MNQRTNERTALGRLSAAMVFAIILIALCGAAPVAAYAFDSGSDGSDGALDVAGGQGVIVFDPRDTARWGRVLDPDGDGVYHFTTINIGYGTTLYFKAYKVNKPVFFLASGPIIINGVLNLDGDSGNITDQLFLRRQVAVPGSGGYAGGAGGRNPGELATPGEGPGGGSGGLTSGTGWCNATNVCGRGGAFTGNRYLVPLVGGSGGEGARWADGNFRAGGAGGGAILLASSTSIAVNSGACITARGGGGYDYFAGSGAGGAIRLVAPELTGSGCFYVNGGGGYGFGSGGPGWVRLEGFDISNSFVFGTGTAYLTRGSPVDASTLRPSGSVRVVAIGGVALPVYPSGTFTLPDAVISSAAPVDVQVEATGIPPGTVVILRVTPDTPEDPATVALPEVQATLQGTTQLSTATVQFSFPYGFSRGYVRARWTQ